jgi:uncharacterized iron-regulated protein
MHITSEHCPSFLKTGPVLFLVFSFVFAFPLQAAHDNLVFKVNDLSQLSLSKLVEDLQGVRVITIGEQHNNREHHRTQLLIISALHEAGYDIAIGFEQFGVRSQAGLESWVAGRSSVEDLFQIYSLDWELNWWPLYLPIFQYAREHEIPMVGLNVSREIVRQVANQGFSSLSDKQRGKIKVLSCNVDQKYQETLSQVLGQKGKEPTGDIFKYFCEAQVVWDTSMALNAVQFIKASPKKALIILAGNFHSWKRGIPEQIRRVMDVEVRSILPSEDTSFSRYDIFLEDADYVWWFEK